MNLLAGMIDQGAQPDTIKRAKPFGDVTHEPQPWKHVETLLFNNARHFKPRTLVA
ncbi:hypothetical protein [Aquabacterium sp.]|uniref:hypothetical protein n=1 Tax=Aquabacterium sp. TaxID=1872578 RepID=UPI0035B1AF37